MLVSKHVPVVKLLFLRRSVAWEISRMDPPSDLTCDSESQKLSLVQLLSLSVIPW
jgi:hypothetical protein